MTSSDDPGATSIPSASSLDAPPARAGITGLTAATAAKLDKGLGVSSIRDLLELTPRRYLDLSKTKSIGELLIGEEATTSGRVAAVHGRYGRGTRKHILTVRIGDGSGYLSLVWFNQPFRARAFSEGMSVAVAGRVDRSKGGPQIVNPFVEPLGSHGVHVGRIIPVHPATAGVTANQIRRFVHEALRRYGARIEDPLPPALLEEAGLIARADAIREMHFPESWERLMRARRRLVFEELFVLSTGLAMRKRRLAREADGIEHRDDRGFVDRFVSSLPFEPTGAQRRTVDEIAQDMAKPHPMNRLLQGEVGSGKTFVAVAASLIAAASGSQTAFMAPTEVLAEQHYLSVSAMMQRVADVAPAPAGMLFADGFEIVLLTGSMPAKERQRARDMAASGDATMVIGTHALIQEGVEFRKLGLAIVDEQHRFGVHQRIQLRQKGSGEQPDVLIMTATPIPRTLALTLYGDLDMSTLDEMPAGRMPVETEIVNTDADREAAYRHIRDEVAAGHQAFIVCPLVEESESLSAKAAESEYERVRAEIFPDLRVGLIHGRMRPSQKDATMAALRAGELDVLVATTVVEVGVDIPNATVMVIEDADRFGLSQLHQLRGRIGRGSAKSRCFLFTRLDRQASDARGEAVARLDAMTLSTDGFVLAERDLEIRGAGHLFGRGSVDEGGKGAPVQTGRGDLQFANLVRDTKVLIEARHAAFATVEEDPTLRRAEHALLLAEVRKRFADRLDWLFAS